MGHVNQYEWVRSHREYIREPVLEVGSRHYAPQASIDYRGLCKDGRYLGVDMSEGANVDLVIDFSDDPQVVEKKLGGETFATVICCSVLEHVENVFQMARNISTFTVSGGSLFLLVPFTWRFHGYPSDYWRFTPRAVEFLFPDFRFPPELGTVSSNSDGDHEPLSDDLNRFVVRPTAQMERSVPRMIRRLLFSHRRSKNPLSRYDYFLVPSTINMLGIKTGA